MWSKYFWTENAKRFDHPLTAYTNLLWNLDEVFFAVTLLTTIPSLMTTQFSYQIAKNLIRSIYTHTRWHSIHRDRHISIMPNNVPMFHGYQYLLGLIFMSILCIRCNKSYDSFRVSNNVLQCRSKFSELELGQKKPHLQQNGKFKFYSILCPNINEICFGKLLVCCGCGNGNGLRCWRSQFIRYNR